MAKSRLRSPTIEELEKVMMHKQQEVLLDTEVKLVLQYPPFIRNAAAKWVQDKEKEKTELERKEQYARDLEYAFKILRKWMIPNEPSYFLRH